jgi:hypothetical protein
MYNQEQPAKAKELFLEGEKLFQELDAESKNSEPEIMEHRKALAAALNVPIT